MMRPSSWAAPHGGAQQHAAHSRACIAARPSTLQGVLRGRRRLGAPTAAASDLDSFFTAEAPFSTLRRFDDLLFREMDAFGGGSSSTAGVGPFSRMQQQMAAMDRQLDRAFADMDRVERELDAQLARNLRQLQEQQQPGVRIERREERQPGSYRYYESIQLRSGGGMSVLTPATTHAPAGLASPLLVLALVLAGAYAAVTAAFARNFALTKYGERSRWQLLALWPALALLSKSFREQFSAAMRGERVRLQPEVLPDGDTQHMSEQRQQ